VTAAFRFTPNARSMGIGVRPSAEWAWHLLWEDGAPSWDGDGVATRLVNQAVTSAMLSQYSRAEEAPVRVSQYSVMLSST